MICKSIEKMKKDNQILNKEENSPSDSCENIYFEIDEIEPEDEDDENEVEPSYVEFEEDEQNDCSKSDLKQDIVKTFSDNDLYIIHP